MTFSKGDKIIYAPDCGFHRFSGHVVRVHRDGDFTVVLAFLLNDDGAENVERPFTSRYRINGDAISPFPDDRREA
jgi:hypothetical protein